MSNERFVCFPLADHKKLFVVVVVVIEEWQLAGAVVAVDLKWLLLFSSTHSGACRMQKRLQLLAVAPLFI